MPRNKDLKRLTRARMRKTGEAYTSARAQLLKKKAGAGEAAERRDLATLAGMSDEAVRKATGRDWDGWVRALDRLGARSMPHGEIARMVRENGEASSWWTQTVTVGYERIHGLRAIGQRRSGSWEVNKSKTVAVPLARLYRAFRLARTRDRWLPGATFDVRKATPEKSMRVTWDDGTPVDIHFYAKGECKSQVTIQHRQLAGKAEADRLRGFWTERLAELAKLLTV